MFPRYPISVIIADLQVTRSLELTVENILEGRVQIPARFQEDDEFDDGSAPNTAPTTPAPFTANDYYVNPHFSDSSTTSSPERESSPNNSSSFDSCDLKVSFF